MRLTQSLHYPMGHTWAVKHVWAWLRFALYLLSCEFPVVKESACVQQELLSSASLEPKLLRRVPCIKAYNWLIKIACFGVRKTFSIARLKNSLTWVIG